MMEDNTHYLFYHITQLVNTPIRDPVRTLRIHIRDSFRIHIKSGSHPYTRDST